MTGRDGHVRVLPVHVANKIAAGEVVERPASVVKELVENSLDAGAASVSVAIAQGGRKLVSVADDGCGMTRDDALLSLERQATSKILDVGDIERIDTLGFRGEAIPSIASVSRFTLTTRRRDSDEGTLVQVNAGELAEVRAAGCPPGTIVEVRDLFCNVPARRKFLKSYATEESHVKDVFTVHALAHPGTGFSLSVDGRELYRLAPAERLADRVRDLFGRDFAERLLPIPESPADRNGIRVTGFVERPNLDTPTRRSQYVFVNSRPATAPTIAYALREAYPRGQGDSRPAVVIFIDLPPTEVDVNVHPTKREVRFRSNAAVKSALMCAIGSALAGGTMPRAEFTPAPAAAAAPVSTAAATTAPAAVRPAATPAVEAPRIEPDAAPEPSVARPAASAAEPAQAPVQVEFAVSPDSTSSRPWKYYRYLAQTESGFLILETDAGIVTMNPRAARERIAYERLVSGSDECPRPSQALLVPETVRLSPSDAARLRAALDAVAAAGFAVEEFGRDTFKVDAVPQMLDGMPSEAVLATIAKDLAEAGPRRGGARWREEAIARSVARSYAGASRRLTEEGAKKLVDELCACRMPYVCPRGKPTLFFMSTRELNRKFALD